MKKTYTILTKETTTILISNNAVQQIDSLVMEKNYSSFFIICDQTTKQLFAEKIIKSLEKLEKPIEIHTLPNGEESKSVQQLFRLLEHLIEKNLDRKSAIVALGGGVVGDIVTTAAGIFLRGGDCIQIPTTLLSQVDASVGGKGAVNFRQYKNVIGVIRQPRIIIVDPSLLKSLPDNQLTSGMGEVIKYAIAMDKELFEKLENFKDKDMGWVIERCISLKMSIVQKDPYEKTGLRQLLNFGHTLGHAIELYTRLSHGEAISIGMVFAIKVSQKLTKLSVLEAIRAIDLLRAFGLPISLPKTVITKKIIYEHMQKDKKAVMGIPTFVLLESIGKAKAGCNVPKNVLDEILEEILI